jgi:hypothetical protein
MKASARWVLLGGFVLLTRALSAQQTPSRDTSSLTMTTGTAVLSGTVVNDLTSQPVRRAAVTLSSADRSMRMTAVTDDTGTFAFRDLPVSRYFLGADKPGYVSSSYGAKRVGRPGTTLALSEGQHKTGVTLRLPPGAVLTGTVRNRNGEPLPGVRVVVLRSSFGYDTGERTLSPVAWGFGEATDDRGVYRVFGLPSDDYFVVVTAGPNVRNSTELRETTSSEVEWATRQLQGQSGLSTRAPDPGPAVDYAPVFYPGVLSQASASTISVKEGEERAGVDVVLEMTPTAKITGTVVWRDGTLPPTVQVSVVAHDTIPGIPFSGFGTARVDRNGKFISAGLSPGDYTIAVRVGASPGGGRGGALSPAASVLFGATTVTVNGSDVDAMVALESGATVSGRLIFEGSTLKPPPDLSKIRVTLTAVRSKTPSLGVPAVNADGTGTFTFSGVTPGRYRLSALGVGGWQLRSAIVQGRDTLDEPFEITNEDVRSAEIRFTDLPTEISGDLRDAAGHPAPEYFIIVFPADKTYWTPQSRRIQSTRPASDGQFHVQNLPPGEYRIGAVTDVEPGEWYDPSFLAQLVDASTTITLAEGEKKVQSLRLSGEPRLH